MASKITIDTTDGSAIKVTTSYASDRGFETRNGEEPVVVSPGSCEEFSVSEKVRITIEELPAGSKLELKEDA